MAKTTEERVYLGLGLQKDKDEVHGDRAEVGQLELEAESLHSSPLKEKGICFSNNSRLLQSCSRASTVKVTQVFKLPELTFSDISPPSSEFLKQHLQLGTKYSNACDCGGGDII